MSESSVPTQCMWCPRSLCIQVTAVWAQGGLQSVSVDVSHTCCCHVYVPCVALSASFMQLVYSGLYINLLQRRIHVRISNVPVSICVSNRCCRHRQAFPSKHAPQGLPKDPLQRCQCQPAPHQSMCMSDMCIRPANAVSLMLCSEMDELLTDVSPELVDEFSRDFFDNRGRKILHDSRRWRVLDTWIGDPAQYFRQAVYLYTLVLPVLHAK